MSGAVIVKGSVGYASQEAWVFSATMRDNILFGLPYEPEKYDAVIEACALEMVSCYKIKYLLLLILIRILNYFLKEI